MILGACLGAIADFMVGLFPLGLCCGCVWLPFISAPCGSLIGGALEVVCAAVCATVSSIPATLCAPVMDLVGAICG